ncbi:MAG: protealysin inhibitor emfourin [Acidobacteriota bacterium]
MRIEVRRTGGVAGIARTFEVDTAQLPGGRAAEIERLARGLAARRSQDADAFMYVVTIDGETFAVEDAAELIEAITA